MKVPVELEHLVKSTSGLSCVALSKHLSTIEERKSLELEHYLRACAFRLGLNAAAGASVDGGV